MPYIVAPALTSGAVSSCIKPDGRRSLRVLTLQVGSWLTSLTPTL